MNIAEPTMTTLRATEQARRAADLDDILSRWHHWLRPVGSGKGHATTACGMGLYRPSRQYDDANGALDDEIDHRVMQGVQACVDKLQQPYSAAIHIEARNLHLGVSVCRMGRVTQAEHSKEITAEARRRLTVLLVSAGILE